MIKGLQGWFREKFSPQGTLRIKTETLQNGDNEYTIQLYDYKLSHKVNGDGEGEIFQFLSWQDVEKFSDLDSAAAELEKLLEKKRKTSAKSNFVSYTYIDNK